MLVFILWIALCFVVASLGSGRTLGYWGVFFISLIFSPLIGLIAALVSKETPKPLPEFKCKHCGFVSKVNSHFCPACERDDLGKTKEDYKKQSEIKSP